MIIEDIEIEKLSDYEVEMLQRKWKTEKKAFITIKVNDENNELVGEFKVPKDLKVRTFKSIILNKRYN